MDESLEITISFSDFGYPLFLPEEGSRLRLQVYNNEINIAGNRKGLEALAKAILPLARSKNRGHHLHLDDLYADTIQSPQGYGLTRLTLAVAKTE